MSEPYPYKKGDLLVNPHRHRLRPIYPPKSEAKTRLMEELVEFTIKHTHGSLVGSSHSHVLAYEVEEVEVEP